jgi:hypothetical protein
MMFDDLKPNMLVADGRTLLKISTVGRGHFTAQVVYPLPPRTQVRSYTAEQCVAFSTPSHGMVAKYERAYKGQR